MVNKGVVFIGDVSGNLGTINNSGQLRVEAAVSIPPVSADVSGNTVYLPNDGVNNVVSISGQTVVASVNVAANVSGNTIYFVDDGVRNVVKISGQSVVVTSGATRNVSGSVTNISGNHVSVSGIVAVNSLPVISISGNAVLISGQTVAIAGGISSNVSGNTVYFVDDSINNKVKISGQTIIAQISGQTVTISNAVSTGVSGQTVYFVNDGVNNIVKISGQLVAVSGIVNIGNATIAVTLPTTPTSGDAARISGQTIYIIDDSVNNKVKISGQLVAVSGIVNVGNTVAVTLPTTPTSGDAVRISGQTIYIIDDSVNNKVKISGQLVAVSGTVQTLSGSVMQISGQAVKISGETLSISGIVTVNSLPVISVSGNVVATSGTTVYFVDNGVNNVVKISGQTVVASVSLGATPTSGDAARISGQTIYLVDDSVNNRVKISGQLVSTSGTVVSLSGSVTQISGQSIRLPNDGVNNVVSISGQTVVTSVTTNISGQAIQITNTDDGVRANVLQNDVDTVGDNNKGLVVTNLGYGLDTFENKFARLRVTASGDGFRLLVSISGQPIQGSFSANVSGNAVRVSGQTIYLVDDSINNKVKISGQMVAISGTVQTLSGSVTQISGQLVVVSGTVVSLSGSVTQISGQLVAISGTTVVLSGSVIQISGQSVRLTDDGVVNVVKISGQTVTVSGNVVNVSGATVSVSGSVSINNTPTVLVSGGVHVSGDTVAVSGIVRMAIPTAVRTRALLSCVALSGGTQLLSGDIRKATLVNAGSAGTVMYIGSTTDPPFSGQGLYLIAGNGVTIETNNFNNIRVFAATSGIFVSYLGEQY